MKTIHLLTYVLILGPGILLGSCSASRNNSLLVTREEIKGNWILNDISYSGGGENEHIKLSLLDDADIGCFNGSNWVLPDNAHGSYTLRPSFNGCNPGPREISWSYVQTDGEAFFLLKKLNPGVNTGDQNEGYRMKVLAATKTTLTLQSVVDKKGEVITLNYNFKRK